MTASAFIWRIELETSNEQPVRGWADVEHVIVGVNFVSAQME